MPDPETPIQASAASDFPEDDPDDEFEAAAIGSNMEGEDELSEVGSDYEGDEEEPDDDLVPEDLNESDDEDGELAELRRQAERHWADEDESDDDGDDDSDEDDTDGTPDATAAADGAGGASGDDGRAETAGSGADGDKLPTMESAKLQRVEWPKTGTVYIEFDLETSGDKKAKNRVIQLASKGADAAGKTIEQSFSELVYISSAISKHVIAVHNLTRDDLKKAKGDFGVVGKLWLEWLSPLVRGATTVVLVAHNGMACDFRLLATELARAGLALPAGPSYICIDTLDVIRKSPKLDYHTASVADWPQRNKLSKKQRREGLRVGSPSMSQGNVASYILLVRPAYANAGAQPGDAAPRRATFKSYCGKAHDALADVRGCHLVLTDAPGVWSQRGRKLAVPWQSFATYCMASSLQPLRRVLLRILSCGRGLGRGPATRGCAGGGRPRLHPASWRYGGGRAQLAAATRAGHYGWPQADAGRNATRPLSLLL